MGPSTSAPFFRAQYRVLVLRDASAQDDGARVLAICVDQNLVGRGSDLPDALEDLKGTIWSALTEEWENLSPSSAPDPDPLFLGAFNDPEMTALDGDPVLERMFLRLKVFATRPQTAGHHHLRDRVRPRMTFEHAHA